MLVEWRISLSPVGSTVVPGVLLERFGQAVRQVIDMGAELSEPLNAPLDPLLRLAAEQPRDAASDSVAEVYRTDRRRLVSLAFAITLDAAIAEEVVQEAFVGLHRNSARIDNLLGYLQRSVVNLSVTVIRRRRMVERHARPPMVQLAASAPEVEGLWSTVIKLPPNQRAVIVLRFWEDMTIDMIAETLGWPAGSVKSTLHRAITDLRKVL